MARLGCPERSGLRAAPARVAPLSYRPCLVVVAGTRSASTGLLLFTPQLEKEPEHPKFDNSIVDRPAVDVAAGLRSGSIVPP